MGGKRLFPSSGIVIALASVFVLWSAWLVVSTNHYLSQVEANVATITKLSKLTKALRGLSISEEGRPASASEDAARWAKARRDCEQALVEAQAQAASHDAVSKSLVEVRRALDQMDAHARVLVAPGTSDAEAAHHLRLFHHETTLAGEAIADATAGVRVSQANISTALLFNWKQLGVLALLSCGIAITLAVVWRLYARKVDEDRRQTQQQLDESEERYRSLFENSPVPMWEVDLSGVKAFVDELHRDRIADIRRYFNDHPDAVRSAFESIRMLHVNRAGLQLHGAESERLLIEHLGSLFNESELVAVRESVLAFCEGKTWFAAEVPTLTLTGERKLVDLKVALSKGAESNWDSVIVAFNDITENRRMETQLRQAQKMEAVGRLAGGVAHDFNNLLTVIIGHCQLALARTPAGAGGRDWIEQVLRCGERAAALTSRLLAFGRRQVTRPRPIDLSAVVEEMRKLIERLVGDNIELCIVTGANLPATLADPDQMQQVVMNLVVNARDAMPRGGRLVIETSSVELSTDGGQARDGRHVVLSVSDSGMGMDEETKNRIFEPFFTTKQGKGTGLGLATVYGIVQQSGGFTTVESSPGRGATFKIFLPACEGMAESPAEPIREAAASGGTETILVVEDEPSVRSLVRESLESVGYRVVTAEDGESALRLLGKLDRVDLLLTDVAMPGMNGPELVSYASCIREDLKFLCMSGYSDKVFQRGGDVARGVSFLQKPFTPATLAEKVREVLGPAQSSREPFKRYN